MYQFSYSEVIEDDPHQARERERHALDQAVRLLRAAERQGPASRECAEALLFLRQVWTILIDDLAGADNGLPESLRASLISIGIWVMRQSDEIRLDRSRDFQGLIAVNETIRDGLIRATAVPELAA